jgi:hypothetical protein
MNTAEQVYSQNQLTVGQIEETNLEKEEEKKNKDIMKKYYRSRYATFLKTLND